ncbi:hypothetical protein D9615_003217 [Tricholomella constricta]|uniref:Uncharacterized protein n=1 Tax=Tricholomella constricta TaxID=117010 RepID=A0A8H5HJJ6_9AGAR|nr:hypothetical protein D9615_003217 [Tricholomella constricta]
MSLFQSSPRSAPSRAHQADGSSLSDSNWAPRPSLSQHTPSSQASSARSSTHSLTLESLQNHGESRAQDANNSNNCATAELARKKKALKSWCDRLANTLSLKAPQLADLYGMIDLGRDFPEADMRLRIYAQASTLQVLNAVEGQTVQYLAFKETLDEVKEVIGAGKFAITRAQMENLTVYAKDLLFDPSRTKYMVDFLEANAQRLGFDKIFGNPAKERILLKACRDKCSNARNQMRKWAHDHVLVLTNYKAYRTIKDPKIKCNLEKATLLLAEKLKRGGPGTSLHYSHQLHLAILRSFAWDYYEAPGAPSPDLDTEDDEDDEDDEDPVESPDVSFPSRKRKKKLHFWKAYDKHWQDLIKTNGEDLLSVVWQQYYNSLIQRDVRQWGRLTGRLMPALPVMYTSTDSAITASSIFSEEQRPSSSQESTLQPSPQTMSPSQSWPNTSDYAFSPMMNPTPSHQNLRSSIFSEYPSTIPSPLPQPSHTAQTRTSETPHPSHHHSQHASYLFPHTSSNVNGWGSVTGSTSNISSSRISCRFNTVHQSNSECLSLSTNSRKQGVVSRLRLSRAATHFPSLDMPVALVIDRLGALHVNIADFLPGFNHPRLSSFGSWGGLTKHLCVVIFLPLFSSQCADFIPRQERGLKIKGVHPPSCIEGSTLVKRRHDDRFLRFLADVSVTVLTAVYT